MGAEGMLGWTMPRAVLLCRFTPVGLLPLCCDATPEAFPRATVVIFATVIIFAVIKVVNI